MRKLIDRFTIAVGFNIPRYVDTFEEEEPIDLDVVATDLAELETKMHTVDADIADFCSQLNIKAPF